MNKEISISAKHELRDILISQIGKKAYDSMIEKICKELHELKLRIEPLFENPSDETFRDEIMKEYILKLKDDEMIDVKITLCDIALDTILD